MRKITDLFSIKRTPKEALKIGRILNRAFQAYEGYENHHYRWCYRNPFFKGRKQHIKDFFEMHKVNEKVFDNSVKYIGNVRLEKIEAKQSIVGWERVNHKIMGDTNHKQKDPELDVRYPIVVYNSDEGMYYIWDGNNRIVAALLLGEEDIKCRIIYPTLGSLYS